MTNKNNNKSLHMKTELELNEMILGITNKIKLKDPELLKLLNEMPITVPYNENPEIANKTLLSYYDSLVKLLHEHEESLPKTQHDNIMDVLPITSIKTMELDNSYQNLVVTANNLTISYNEAGTGSVPIIFLHGFPFDKSMWSGQLDCLKSSFRVIALDLRGFGHSKDELAALSIDLFSDDLIAFMDKLNIQKATICGLSMGGYIALNTIKKFPERIEKLILCDTQCIADTAEVKENRYKTINQINLEGTANFNEKFAKSTFSPNSLISQKETVENLQNIVSANSKEIIMSGLIALAERSENCSILSSIYHPTLIICGREDEITPLAQSEFMHKNIKASTLKIIENAGHVSNLEQNEAFNNCLIDFLNATN